jgi:DNA modification methylase
VIRRGPRPRLPIGDNADFDPKPIIERFASTAEQFWWGTNNYAERIPKLQRGSWIVWDKSVEERFDRMFGSCFEMCWSRRRHKYLIARVQYRGIFGMHGPDARRYHPTQKPVKLAAWFLDRYSKPEALVADLFAGSGGTLLACEQANRRCNAMELSEQYYDIIINRYEAMAVQPRLMDAS